jgi:hypothetical protein
MEDVSGCLAALRLAEATPSLDAFVCENGGADAYEQLSAHLVGPQGTCVRLEYLRRGRNPYA